VCEASYFSIELDIFEEELFCIILKNLREGRNTLSYFYLIISFFWKVALKFLFLIKKIKISTSVLS